MPGSGMMRMELVLDPWLEATRELEAQVRDNPTFADLRHLLGLLRLARGDARAAVAEFDAALQSNPGYRRARFSRLVAMRLRDGELDPVVWMQEAPGEGEEEPERCLWTAWFLAQGGDREGARAALRRLVEQPAWAATAWYALSVYETAWGETAAACAGLQAAGRSHPLYQGVLESRGRVACRATGHTRTVTPAVEAPLRDDAPEAWNPVAADLCCYLGALCARHGKLSEGQAFFDEAFLRLGRESMHQVCLSQLALARGDEEEAVSALRRAIEVDPTSVPARIALGFEYQSQGYQEEAIVQFEVAARLRPDYPDVQYNLGLLHESQGRIDDALRCLRRALEVNPQYFQARMTLASVLRQRERWSEALDELSRLSGEGVRSADLHAQRAEALLALDRPKDAVRELQEGTALNPAYARTYYILGQAYRRMGLRRKAQNAWQQYLERSQKWGDLQPMPAGEEEQAV
jgi:tetratricopeptide (TPR) repeat protein